MNDYWFTENISESTITISDDDLEKVRSKLKRERAQINRKRPPPKKKNINTRKCFYIAIAITALVVLGVIAIIL